MPGSGGSGWRAAAVVLGAGLAGAIAVPAPASAHVTVDPSTAVQGGFARLAFRVPTESDTAPTTKVEVYLPDNAPVSSVSTMPVPGWTVSVQRRKLAQPIDVNGAQIDEVVSVLTWTASTGGAIRPGQFQEFPVSLGPLPKVDTMVFKALQTYSDGRVVRWIEEPAADGREPESPAPVLRLTPAPDPSATPPAAAPPAARTGGDGSGALPIGLGAAGLAAGLGGLVLGGLALARTRRTGEQGRSG